MRQKKSGNTERIQWEGTYLICVRASPVIAALASSCEDITTNPRRRDALSTVASMTQWETEPYLENIKVNSVLIWNGIQQTADTHIHKNSHLVSEKGRPRTYRLRRPSTRLFSFFVSSKLDWVDAETMLRIQSVSYMRFESAYIQWSWNGSWILYTT